MASAAPIYYQAAILFLLLHCAWTDLTTFKIRNNSVLAILAVVALFWVAGWREFQFIDVALAAILFVIGLGLWMYRVMGGGDVKLLAATVLAIGSQSALPFAFALLAAGMLWLMAVRYWLILDYYLPLPAQFRDAMSKRRVPYAVCIAIAAFVAMAMDWRG